MRPLTDFSRDAANALRGVVFDLDDTLLDRGELTEPAYSALFRLRESGLELFACTGRPAGWADVIARQWPIDGAIAENGAIAFVREAGRTRRVDGCAAEERARRRRDLSLIADAILARHPELERADDNDARSSDVTLDIGEHRRAPADVVASALREAREAGARTFVSSVHMHLTFDAFDKASGTVQLLASRGIDPTLARVRYAYVGDSENDGPAFSAFRHTFGVANVRGRAARLSVTPRFIATRERGLGFAEIAQRLSALRQVSS